jgi:RepB DNA-primase from phage plasmid
MSVEIPQRDALYLQAACIAGNEPETSLFELRPLFPDGRPGRRTFIPVTDRDAVAALVREQRESLNAYVGAAPRVREDGTAGAVERVWCLWADIDGRTALEALAAFRPLPSIVIRSGSPDCAHAYWPLKVPVAPSWAQRANRRLALALGGDMAATDPARILRPAGTLNHKHKPPAPVTCTRLELDVFTVDQVVGELPDTSHYTRRPTVERPAASDPSRLLAGVARTVAEAHEGNRNAALFWAACRAAEHVGELDVEEALSELRAAAAHAGLGEVEIERTLRSGLDAGARAAA